MKICSRCKTEKNASLFHKSKTSKDGLVTVCKICVSDYCKERYTSNPQRHIKNAIKWQNDNKDRVKTKVRERNKKNPKKVKARNQKFDFENPDRRKILIQNWHKNNPEKINFYSSTRRSSKLKATPKWLTEDHFQQIKDWYSLAKDLQWLSNEKLNVDHIVPLQGKNVSGLHVPWNLQILPASKNQSKGNRTS